MSFNNLLLQQLVSYYPNSYRRVNPYKYVFFKLFSPEFSWQRNLCKSPRSRQLQCCGSGVSDDSGEKKILAGELHRAAPRPPFKPPWRPSIRSRAGFGERTRFACGRRPHRARHDITLSLCRDRAHGSQLHRRRVDRLVMTNPSLVLMGRQAKEGHRLDRPRKAKTMIPTRPSKARSSGRREMGMILLMSTGDPVC